MYCVSAGGATGSHVQVSFPCSFLDIMLLMMHETPKLTVSRMRNLGSASVAAARQYKPFILSPFNSCNCHKIIKTP